MAEAHDPVDVLSNIGKTWAGVAVLATVVVYALGFLSLRSYHTALGIDVDLGVFDDRYPLAGARFLVFALACLVTWAIPVLMLAAVWHAVRGIGGPLGLRPPGWLREGLRFVLLGLLAFATVTFSQVLVIHDLLLDQRIPPRAWAAGKLVCWLAADPDAGGRYPILSFQLLLVLTALTIAWAWHEGWQPGPSRRGLALLLWLLAVVELMLLPVYHGTFFTGQIVRQLEAAPAGLDGLAGDVWLVYRGSTKAVLFAHERAGTPQLITVDPAVLDGQPLVGVTSISKLLEIEGCPNLS
jgi:hypothetical protein